MTQAPTVIIAPDRSKPKSDTSQLDMPTTPYKVERNVDADDPIEWSREPSAKSGVHRIRKNPKRFSVNLREKVIGQAGKDIKRRRIQFPDLFNRSRYTKPLIAQQLRSYPEDREYRVWIDEVIAAGSHEDHRKKFIITKHPGFPAYDALFELIRATPERGLAGMKTESAGHYRLVSIAMTPPVPGYLPSALSEHGDRWEDMRSRMGDPRRFTRRDFEIIKAGGDSESVTGAELDALIGKFQVAADADVIRKLKWIALCKRHEAREAKEYDDKDKIENDFVLDMLEYYFDWLVQAANYGKRHKVFMFQPGADPRYVEWQHENYKERVRLSSPRLADFNAALDAAIAPIVAKWSADQGLRRNWTPTDDMWAEAAAAVRAFGGGFARLMTALKAANVRPHKAEGRQKVDFEASELNAAVNAIAREQVPALQTMDQLLAAEGSFRR